MFPRYAWMIRELHERSVLARRVKSVRTTKGHRAEWSSPSRGDTSRPAGVEALTADGINDQA